jgi:hypothetical protein
VTIIRTRDYIRCYRNFLRILSTIHFICLHSINGPQAWAAASVFQLLQAMHGLQTDAPNHSLYVGSYLPEYLPQLRLKHVEVGKAVVGLRFFCYGDSIRWDASV